MSEDAVRLPVVLILGGCGFVGRNLVNFLVRNNMVHHVKVADKSMPVMSYFHEQFLTTFDSPIVEYQQADLTKPDHLTKVFTTSENIENIKFDFVFNLAAETRHGQPESLYASRCTDLSKHCAEKALECGVKRFIEVSTALVYAPNTKQANSEGGDIAPWTTQAKYKHAAEEEVLAVGARGLDVVIFRPAFIYGPGDTHMMMTRAACAAAYVELHDKMCLLWDAGLRVNTVHVEDTVRALWHGVDAGAVPAGSVWNLCDKNDTDQGKINALLASIFNISCGFHGFIISNLARLSLKDVVDHANEKHLLPWDTLCKRHNIMNTPITPYTSLDLLRDNSLYVDGSAIETTGFRYTHPILTREEYLGSVRAAVEAEIFPPVIQS